MAIQPNIPREPMPTLMTKKMKARANSIFGADSQEKSAHHLRAITLGLASVAIRVDQSKEDWWRIRRLKASALLFDAWKKTLTVQQYEILLENKEPKRRFLYAPFSATFAYNPAAPDTEPRHLRRFEDDARKVRKCQQILKRVEGGSQRHDPFQNDGARALLSELVEEALLYQQLGDHGTEPYFDPQIMAQFALGITTLEAPSKPNEITRAGNI